MISEISQEIRKRKIEEYHCAFRHTIEKITKQGLIVDGNSQKYVMELPITGNSQQISSRPHQYLTYQRNNNSFSLILTAQTQQKINLPIINNLNTNFLTTRNIKLYQNAQKKAIECASIYDLEIITKFRSEEMVYMVEGNLKEMLCCLGKYFEGVAQENKKRVEEYKRKAGQAIEKEEVRKVGTLRETINLLNRFKNLLIQQIQSRHKSIKLPQKQFTVKTIEINPELSSQNSSTNFQPENSELQFQSIKEQFRQKAPKPSNKKPEPNFSSPNDDAIVKMITFLKMEYLKWKPQCGDNYGKISKIKAEFQLNKFSLYKQTNQLELKQRLKKSNEVEDKKQKSISGESSTSQSTLDHHFQNFLIQKTHNPLIDKQMNSFRIEVLILLKFRDAKCQSIASYFLEEIKSVAEISRFFIDCYPKDFSQIIGLKNFKAKNFLSIFKNLCKGIEFLWKKKILHRDLKPSNIMLDSTYCPKIIDFGSSSPQHSHYCSLKKQKKQSLYNIDFRLISTPGYYYPYENFMKLKNQYEFSREEYEMHENFDVYSLGSLFEHVFTRNDVKESLGQQVYSNIDWLFRKCQLPNPDDRPNPEEISIFMKIICKLWLLQNKPTK